MWEGLPVPGPAEASRGLPEGLIVQALISQVVVLQVQLPQVAQLTEGAWWNLLQLVVLGEGQGAESMRQPRGKSALRAPREP